MLPTISGAAGGRFRGRHQLQAQQGRLARGQMGRAAPAARRRYERGRPRSTSRCCRRSASPRPCRRGASTSPQARRRSIAKRKDDRDGSGIDWATAEALAFGSLLAEGARCGSPARTPAAAPSPSAMPCWSTRTTEEKATSRSITSATSQATFEVIDSRSPKPPCSASSTATAWPSRPRWCCGRRSSATSPTAPRSSSTSSSRPARPSGCACPASSAAAARLRGPGAGALARPARALPAALRRGQHPGRQLHHPGQLLPRAAPPAAPQLPQAADRHDAEVAAAPQALRLRPCRLGARHPLPSRAGGRPAGPGQQGAAAWCCAPARSITTCCRSARERPVPTFVGRRAAASPATGSFRSHVAEQKRIVEQVLTADAHALPQPFMRVKR
jgi:hypothetical protein